MFCIVLKGQNKMKGVGWGRRELAEAFLTWETWWGKRLLPQGLYKWWSRDFLFTVG